MLGESVAELGHGGATDADGARTERANAAPVAARRERIAAPA